MKNSTDNGNEPEQEIEPFADIRTDAEKILHLNNVIANTDTQLYLLIGKIGRLESGLAELKHSKVANLEVQVNSLHYNTNNFQLRMEDNIRDRDKIICGMQSEIAILDSNITVNNGDIDLLKNRVQDLEHSYDYVEDLVMELKHDVSEIQNSLFDKHNYKTISLK